MTAGLIQLACYGQQDIFLIGDPQITFFKTVFRRYSNFSIEQQIVPCNGKKKFGSSFYGKLPKVGDLAGKIYAVIDLPAITMKYTKTQAEEIAEIMNSIGITLTTENPATLISNQITDLETLLTTKYVPILAALENLKLTNPHPVDSDIISILQSFATNMNDQTMFALYNFLITTHFYNEKIGFKTNINCTTGDATKDMYTTSPKILLKLPEILDAITQCVNTVVFGEPNSNGDREMELYTRLENLILETCDLEFLTVIQLFDKLLGISNEKCSERSTDFYNIMSFIINQLSATESISTIWTVLKDFIWKGILYNIILSINTFRGLAESIGDTILYRTSPVDSNGLQYLSPNPAEPYCIHTLGAFEEQMTDLSWFSTNPFIIFPDTPSSTFLTNHLSEYISLFGDIFNEADANTPFDTYYTQPCFRADQLANIAGYPSDPSWETVYYMNGIVLLYNKFIRNYLLKCLQGNFQTDLDALYNTNIPLISSELFPPSYINQTIDGVKGAGPKVLLYIFYKNPTYTLTWVVQQYIDLLNGLIPVTTDPTLKALLETCLTNVTVFLNGSVTCPDPVLTMEQPPPPKSVIDCINLDTVDIFLSSCSENVAPIPPIVDPCTPAPPPPPPPPTTCIFNDDTFLDTQLAQQVIGWNNLMTFHTLNYNLLFGLFLLNIQALANQIGQTTADNVQTAVNMMIEAYNADHPDAPITDFNNIPYNILGTPASGPNPQNKYVQIAIDYLQNIILPGFVDQLREYRDNRNIANFEDINVPCEQYYYEDTNTILTYLLSIIAPGGPFLPDYESKDTNILPNCFNELSPTIYTIREINNELIATPGLTTEEIAFLNMMTTPFLVSQTTLIREHFRGFIAPYDYIRYLIYLAFNSVSYMQGANIYLNDVPINLDGLIYYYRTIIQTTTNRLTLLKTALYQVEQIQARTSQYSKFAWIRRIGHFIIDSISIEIGGQQVDKQYGDWMNIWYELTRNEGKVSGYNKMIGDVIQLYHWDNKGKEEYQLFIPLDFWFCRYAGAYLPLTAMQYQDVIIRLDTNSLEHCCYKEPNTIFVEQFVKKDKQGNTIVVERETLPKFGSVNLLVDYIYLDRDERFRIAGSRHEYLIEQLQTREELTINKDNFSPENPFRVKLSFHNTCRELVWFLQLGSVAKLKKYGCYSYDPNIPILEQTDINTINSSVDCQTTVKSKTLCDTEVSMGCGKAIYSKAWLEFDGIQRIHPRESRYFNYVQPYQHHSASPPEGVGVYSFALFPEEYPPSGAANLSRITKIYLVIELIPEVAELIRQGEEVKIRVFATTGNVLRVMSGMSGLAIFVSE